MALIAVGAVLMLATTAASASAPGNGFAARARSAGLTAAQVGALQQEVDVFIGHYGGRQVAINKVAFAGGSVLFPVPGRNARAVANASAGQTVETTDTTSCPLGAFCAWPDPNYGGARRAFYACGTDWPNPFLSDQIGSWKNDQTPQNGSGPRVKMLDSHHDVIYTTAPPWSASTAFSWFNVYYFRVC
jgi:hypothetical protein